MKEMKLDLRARRAMAGLLAAAAGTAAALAQPNSPVPAYLSAEATPAYREAVLSYMLEEANAYAVRLNLAERFPITAQSLREQAVVSPRVAALFGALGSLRTTNYSYAFGKGRRLTYITRLRKDDSAKSLADGLMSLAIPPEAVDTNQALVVATQLLARAFVDLAALSRWAAPHARPIQVRGVTTSVYDVEWDRSGEPVAGVKLGQPAGEVWSLRIEDPQFISRKPLDLTGLIGPLVPRAPPWPARQAVPGLVRSLEDGQVGGIALEKLVGIAPETLTNAAVIRAAVAGLGAPDLSRRRSAAQVLRAAGQLAQGGKVDLEFPKASDGQRAWERVFTDATNALRRLAPQPLDERPVNGMP
jgi:hypothetical protein